MTSSWSTSQTDSNAASRTRTEEVLAAGCPEPPRMTSTPTLTAATRCATVSAPRTTPSRRTNPATPIPTATTSTVSAPEVQTSSGANSDSTRVSPPMASWRT